MSAPSIGERLARLRSAIGAPTAMKVSDVRDVAIVNDAVRTSDASLVPSFPSKPATPGPTLAERIARARGGPGAKRDHGIEALRRATGGVPCGDDLLCVETRIRLPHMHGRTRLVGDARRPLALPIRAGETLVRPAGDVLLLDTETSGLAGEAALLAQVRAAVESAGCIVTFNGKSFDVPLLKGRFALRREAHPFDGLPHSDLLHASRRHLRDDWSDCRLRTAEERALGFHRVDDLPGAEVPEVWRRWLAFGDMRDLPRVLAHNREDLVSLLALVQLLGTTEGRLPLFSTPLRGRGRETRKTAGHEVTARVQRGLQDPQAVEVLV